MAGRADLDVTRRRFIVTGGAAAALALGGRLGLTDARRPAMSHRERIERALALEPTDRIPFGFWWHFPNRDRSPRRLAELQLALQRSLDLDFVKFSPYGLYSVVDWGVTLDIRGGQQTPVQDDYPIKRPGDWRKLQPFRPDEGEYLVVLEAQRIALQELAVVRPYDLPVLEAVQGRSWFNIFHLHGENVMFDQVLDTPVQAFNYHDREGGGPSLGELRKRTDKCLVGGLGRRTTLVHGTPAEVDAEVRDAWDQVGRRGLILGPGCVVSLDTPGRNLRQLRRSVEATADL